MVDLGTGHHQLLLGALRDPPSLIARDAREWELLLRLARRIKLLGFLAVELEKHGLLDQIPVRAANQLRSSLIQAKKLQQSACWELNRIIWALSDHEIPIIVLKGMAYLLQGLPNAAGRAFVDLDLLVPKENLNQIESSLLKKGWRHHALSAYDERYYREWSHEIPAFVHNERGTEVDIHHTLVSPLGKLKINPLLFWETAIKVNDEGIYVLSPEDMTLHCAINLFQNNELSDDLRHLLDFHGMLQFFSNNQPLFWGKLVERANQLGVGRLLFYGLYFSRLLFGSPIPDNLEKQLNRQPGWLTRCIMHSCVPLALLPLHPDNPSKWAEFARLFLYLRSHWLRMPLHLLLPHLIYKFYLSFVSRQKKASTLRDK